MKDTHYTRLARKGGKALAKKYGPEYFRALAKRRWRVARKRMKLAAARTA